MAVHRPTPPRPPEFAWDRPFLAEYRFERVDRRTRLVKDELRNVIGGSVSRNADSSIRESAALECVGSLGLGADFVRAWLVATPSGGGATVERCLGTFLSTRAPRTSDGAYSTSRADLYGTLRILESGGPKGTLTIPKGTNIVDRCRDIVTDQCNLDCSAIEGDRVLAQARSYGPGVQTDEGEALVTWLDIVNDLLGLAGYSAARTDAMGTVVLEPYVEPAQRPISFAFEEGPGSFFLMDVEEGPEVSDVHNVVVVVSSTSDKVAVGVARDDDPAHAYSTVSLGYESMRVERVSDELDEDGCVARARLYLAEEMAVQTYYKWQFPWRDGVDLDARGTFDVASDGIDADCTVRTMDIHLDAGCLVTVEAKSYGR